MAPQRGLHAIRRATSAVTSSVGGFGTGDNFLEMPPVGTHRLRILTPTVLELTAVTTQTPQGRPQQWDFVNDTGMARLPTPSRFRVTANGAPQQVNGVGFKR